jgi:hypothetical protein
VEFVEELATRISRALGRADACRVASDLRRRVVESMMDAVERFDCVEAISTAALDDMLGAVVASDPPAPVAIFDLGLRHMACTKPYAALLGHDAADVLGTPLVAFVAEEQQLHDGFDRVLASELDFRSIEVVPITGSAPVVLHIAMVRRADDTPWGIVAVAQVVAAPAPAL